MSVSRLGYKPGFRLYILSYIIKNCVTYMCRGECGLEGAHYDNHEILLLMQENRVVYPYDLLSGTFIS